MRPATRDPHRHRQLALGSDPNYSGRDNGERAKYLVPVIADYGGDHGGLVIRGQSGQAEEQNARGRSAKAEHKLAEVLVNGDEHAVFAVCAVEYAVIVDSGSEFSDVLDIVTLEPQPLHDSRLDTFVGEKPHATDWGVGYATSALRTSAPNRTAASTPSRVSRGCASRICSIGSPEPRSSSMASTVIRVPSTTGLPIMIVGSETMRCTTNVNTSSTPTTIPSLRNGDAQAILPP